MKLLIEIEIVVTDEESRSKIINTLDNEGWILCKNIKESDNWYEIKLFRWI